MRKKIEAVLDRIRPALDAHGGDVELLKVSMKEKTAYIKFVGTCDHCAISEVTLKYLVEREVHATCPEITSVVAVQA